MTTIAIVKSTGNPTLDQVLRGVYGTATADPAKPDAVVFSPAPEFRGVSHLFTQVPQIAVSAAHIERREVDDADEAIATAQILFGLGARWASLYESRTRTEPGEVPDIGQALLTGERAAVARGVRQHLEAIGMHVYEVPVLIKGEILSHGSYVSSAAAMVQGMTTAGRTVEVDPDRRPRVLVRSALSGDAGAIEAARPDAYPAEPPPAAGPAPAPMRAPVRSFIRSFFDGPGAHAPDPEPTQAPAVAGPDEPPVPTGISHETWGEFHGVEATVRALVFVVAPDLQSLPRALRYMQQAHEQDGAGMHLETVDVASVRDLQREDLAVDGYQDSDFQDSDYRE